MKKRFYFIPFILLAGGMGIFLGCNKTDHPFGVYAPLGLDRPTYTPTPSSGAIEVYVNDLGTAVQGVSIIVIDPSGNTLGPNLTQPVVGFAAFNPPNLTAGIWTAKVPTQGVSYFTTGSLLVNHYYYLSTQNFLVNGSGTYSVTFSTGGNTVSVAPVSMSYGTSYPLNIPLTVTYNQGGNLNVPVSVTSPSLPTGMSLSASSFIFGEGVTQQPVTFSKSICYSRNIPIRFLSKDFVNVTIITNPVTLFHNFPVPIVMTGQNYSTIDSSCSGNICFNFVIYTGNDCGVAWDYSIVSTKNSGLINYSGAMFPGSSNGIEFLDYLAQGDNLNFTISSPSVGTFSANANNNWYDGSAPVTFYNAVSNQ